MGSDRFERRILVNSSQPVSPLRTVLSGWGQGRCVGEREDVRTTEEDDAGGGQEVADPFRGA
jgi:hypothetical protein